MGMMSTIETQVLKMNILGVLYSLVQENKDAYEEWLETYPDELTESELYYMAQYKWNETLELFSRLYEKYLKFDTEK